MINYFGNDGRPGHFWENTSSNAVISQVLEEADEEILENLNRLLQGETITTFVDTNVIYPQIRKNPASVYSFLLVCGYLKTWKVGMSISGDYLCKLSLPNKEIALVYRKEIIQRISGIIPQAITVGIQEAIMLKDTARLQGHLRRFLLERVSFYDTPSENSYHMLILGLCAVLSDQYYVTSNRESGEGRFDIQLKPRDPAMPGVLIELKAEKNRSAEELKVLAETALRQIIDRKYDTVLQSEGITTIVKYGIAFSGKNVEIVVE